MNDTEMPTTKQRGAFNKMVENGGSMGKIMKDSGYSEAMAKNPHKLTQSKGFQEILEQHGLDDVTLAKKHKELLESKKITRVFNKNGFKTETEETSPMVAKALDMAYKVKGLYAPEKMVAMIGGVESISQLLDSLEERVKN
ncbi:MAG: hypothetical protein NTU76_01300 [Candidatus Taylorbacteria bacterium]|nr:hypothetical protein [Candidatus Taylorbacteria bacterium]